MTEQFQIANFPVVAQFLGEKLRHVLAYERYDREAWSLRRIASYITGSADIEGTVTASTISRLLNPAHAHRPDTQTLEMLADFLLHMRYVSKEELAWAHASGEQRYGPSLMTYFDVPQTQALRTFMQQLTGPYLALRVSNPFAMLSRLTLTYLSAPNCLVANEVITVFQHAGMADYLGLSSKRSAQAFQSAALQLTKPEVRRLADFTASGQVVAANDLIFCLMKKAEDRGFSSILSAASLFYDENDRITHLDFQRNSGWVARDTGDLVLPQSVTADTSAQHVARHLASHPQFFKLQTPPIVEDPPTDPASSSKTFFDAHKMRGAVSDDYGQKPFEEAETPNDKLVAAMDYGRADLFAEALDMGADPNLVIEGCEHPIIWEIAARGHIEFAQGLIATGRCRIEPDEQGRLPTTEIGIMLRTVAPDHGMDETLERFKAIYDLVSGEYHKQLRAKAQNSDDPAP